MLINKYYLGITVQQSDQHLTVDGLKVDQFSDICGTNDFHLFTCGNPSQDEKL